MNDNDSFTEPSVLVTGASGFIAMHCILQLLAPPDNEWYRLFIPPEELEIADFERVRRWEQIAVALLKKYIDRFCTTLHNWESVI